MWNRTDGKALQREKTYTEFPILEKCSFRFKSVILSEASARITGKRDNLIKRNETKIIVAGRIASILSWIGVRTKRLERMKNSCECDSILPQSFHDNLTIF